MRRKVAAVCGTALTLALSGAALAQEQQGQEQSTDSGSAQEQQGQAAEAQEQQGEQQSTQGQAQQPSMEQQGQAQEQSGQQQTGALQLSELDTDGVKEVQRKLQEHGHYQGQIDGVAGAQTMAALNKFQQEKGMSGTGSLDQETLAALGIEQSEIQRVSGSDQPSGKQQGQAQQPSEQQGQAQQPSEQQGQAQQQARQPAGGKDTIQLRTLNQEQVRNLQQRLQELGHYKGEVDGVAGAKTRSALQQFYSSQAMLAGQGMMTEEAAGTFGIDVSGTQPVRGMEPGQQPSQQPQQPSPEQQPQGTQPSPEQQQPQGTQPSPEQQQPGTSPEQQGTSPEQQPGQVPYEQQRIPEETPGQQE